MTPAQIELARHALGLGNGRKVSYRNHYVTGPGGEDYAEWQAMVVMGYAKHRSGSALSGGDDIFWLTATGARAALRLREKLDPEDFPTTTPPVETP